MANKEGIPTRSSALQSLLSTHLQESSNPLQQHKINLALQIAHNLRYQHSWTVVHLHTKSKSGVPLPQPILSGLPPQPLYIHPDEQIEFLQKQKDQPNQSSKAAKLAPQLEWVLPSHLRSKWTLRRFGEVFDAIPAMPPHEQGQLLFQDASPSSDDGTGDSSTNLSNGTGSVKGAGSVNSIDPVNADWRAEVKTPKRVLLATVDDDSTIVYYIVHDGVVKPRQN